jgi:DNA replication protein DnaC
MVTSLVDWQPDPDGDQDSLPAPAELAVAGRQEQCPEHGEFLSKPVYPGSRTMTKCPACAKAAAEKYAAEEARRKAEAEEAQQNDLLRRRLGQSGLKGRMLASTFGSFECSGKAQQDVLHQCRDFVESLNPEAGGGLWLIGPPGTGKTHLGSAMVQHVIRERRMWACVLSAREIITMLRASWGRKVVSNSWDWVPQTTEEIVEHLGNVALLVLDEVGNSFNTEAEQVQLFDVIDLRYKLCRPTVVISNLPAQEMKKSLGDRSYDRLREGARVLQCTWTSARGINRAPVA